MWRVEVVSQETIRPSSPTPSSHLCTHKLSWLDQMSSADAFSIIFFYINSTTKAEKAIHVIKNSLSETLTLFYPLAGRLNTSDTSIVDCNDQGVDLFEARAVTVTPLSDLIGRRRAELADDLSDLLPTAKLPTPMPLSVQITFFSTCHSIAVATSFSHRISDGHSAAEFITAWTNIARSDHNQSTPPVFDAASLFVHPFNDFRIESSEFRRPRGKLVTNSFVFSESAIDALRKSSKCHPPPPSRVVAVAALLWRCSTRARGPSKPASVAIVPINLRGKATELQLSGNLFGNLVAIVAASDVAECGEEKFRSEEKLRNAIRRMDGERVRRILQGAEGVSALLEDLGEAKREVGNYEDVDYYHFSSWSRFPLYDADFGWGKPVWVALAGLFMKNQVVLMGRGGAGGMEVWMRMEEDEMKTINKDEEFLSYVCASSI